MNNDFGSKFIDGMLEAAKDIEDSYSTGMKEGAKLCLPALQKAYILIFNFRRDVKSNSENLHKAETILENEIRRIKGLPF